MARENGIQVPFPFFVFAWHWKTDLNFVVVFRFRLNWKNRFELRISFFVFASLWTTDMNFLFRFRITLINGLEFRFSFSHHFEKWIGISFLVFASLWKTDLNFVFRFCMVCYWKTDLNFFCRFCMTWRTDLCTSPVIWSPRTHPRGWPGHLLFMQVKASEYSFHRAKVSGVPAPHDAMIATKKTRSYPNTCIPSMEKESDEYLKTLQLEVTRCEITKNYKSSFTVFWSFCRITQSHSLLLVVISRIQQIRDRSLFIAWGGGGGGVGGFWAKHEEI